MKYSKNQKLDLLKWMHQKANDGKWFQVNEGYTVGATKMWEEDPVWSRSTSPRRSSAKRAPEAYARLSGAGVRQATVSYTNIIVVMYAEGVQGMKADDAVKWVEGELKKVYEG